MRKIILFFLFSYAAVSVASITAVIDSGLDIEHEALVDQVWLNPVESLNGKDDDGNGLADDIVGWNFAEGNNQLLTRSLIGRISDFPQKYYSIQAKTIKGTISQEELCWMIDATKDPAALRELSLFGNFVHGTHVTSIAKGFKDKNQLLGIKLLPTRMSLTMQQILSRTDRPKGLRENVLKWALRQFAKIQAASLVPVGEYVRHHKADIANGSFGVGSQQIAMLLEIPFKILYWRAPKPEEIKKYSAYALEEMNSAGRAFTEASPDTLFVFAAGNDGTDNDIIPSYPASILTPNVMSVAAVIDRHSLAYFSNYGKERVDIAAPGVEIVSAIPGDDYVAVSGTSQASPYVARVASQLKDINPKLTPLEIKRILMGTVDKKFWLAFKVKSGGIVNDARAQRAAGLSLTMNIDEAIVMAIDEIDDMPMNKDYVSEIGPEGITPRLDRKMYENCMKEDKEQTSYFHMATPVTE